MPRWKGTLCTAAARAPVVSAVPTRSVAARTAIPLTANRRARRAPVSLALAAPPRSFGMERLILRRPQVNAHVGTRVSADRSPLDAHAAGRAAEPTDRPDPERLGPALGVAELGEASPVQRVTDGGCASRTEPHDPLDAFGPRVPPSQAPELAVVRVDEPIAREVRVELEAVHLNDVMTLEWDQDRPQTGRRGRMGPEPTSCRVQLVLARDS